MSQGSDGATKRRSDGGLRYRVTTATVVILIVIAGILGYYEFARSQRPAFVPLVPVVMNDHSGLEDAPQLMTKEFMHCFVELGRSYGYEVRTRRDGTVLIPSSLRDDRDMVCNLTTKAQEAVTADASLATRPRASSPSSLRRSVAPSLPAGGAP